MSIETGIMVKIGNLRDLKELDPEAKTKELFREFVERGIVQVSQENGRTEIKVIAK